MEFCIMLQSILQTSFQNWKLSVRNIKPWKRCVSCWRCVLPRLLLNNNTGWAAANQVCRRRM